MALFFFDVDDGDVHSRDKVGVELPDVQAATKEAVALTGELLRDRPDAFWNAQEWRMTVEDDAGLVLFTIVVAARVAPAAAAVLGKRRA